MSSSDIAFSTGGLAGFVLVNPGLDKPTRLARINLSPPSHQVSVVGNHQQGISDAAGTASSERFLGRPAPPQSKVLCQLLHRIEFFLASWPSPRLFQAFRCVVGANLYTFCINFSTGLIFAEQPLLPNPE
jgi:hypothetical protein